MGEETVFVQFRENKYGTFNWGLQEVHATLLENLVKNPESQPKGSIFFIQGMCFARIPFMLIASAKIPEREGSISPSSFYG